MTRTLKVKLIRKASGRRPVIIERDGDDDSPVKMPKRKAKPAKAEKPALSDKLVDMIGKLAAWHPKSNEDILEAANRLSQAAREEIDRDLEKKGSESGARLCRSLVGHVLGYHNGISVDYTLVLGCTVSAGTVTMDMLKVEPRNRLAGGYVNVCRTKTAFFPSAALLDRKTGNPTICDRKYTLDPPGGLETVTEALVNQESAIRKAWETINDTKPKKKKTDAQPET